MNNELLAVLEYMERERGIEREKLIQAVESALLSASKKSVVPSKDLRVEIDRKTYDIKAFAIQTVVEVVRDRFNEIDLEAARKLNPLIQLGESLEVEVTPRNFGRIAAQTAKQAIVHKLRQAEKDRLYEEFKDRVSQIVSGTINRIERTKDVVVDLGRGEGILPARECVPGEDYQPGERIRAYVLKVDNASPGTTVTLSRSHPEFVRRLFELEVAEIADGTVQIRGIAREAGCRTKIAVMSNDEKVDPVGACVGMRGVRVKNVVRELLGEKIDIVRWHEDVKNYVANALSPAKLLRVEPEEALHVVHVTVAPDQLSLAIGKKGQNARLTAKLTGWKIDIRQEEAEVGFEEKVARAVAALATVEGIGEARAEKLVHAGFLTIEGILAAEIGDLEAIEGFDHETALKIRDVAEKAYEKEHGPIEA